MDFSKQVVKATSELRTFFRTGKTKMVQWRVEQLNAIIRLVRENEERLVLAAKEDLGKPDSEVFLDLGGIIKQCEYAIAHLQDWVKPTPVPTPFVAKPGRSQIMYEPLGLVLVITPWNFPLSLSLDCTAAAISAGNCVVLKPSEISASTSRALAELIPRYLDTSAVRVFEGAVDETSILLQQRWDHIMYTGNGVVAKVVLEAAAKYLTPVTLELGGKSPCVVWDDADLQVAARRICWAKFFNAGQICVAPDYLLVHESIHDRFVDLLKKTIREFFAENPRNSNAFGRIINTRHTERLAKLIEPTSHGGSVAIGGSVDVASKFIEPTVIVGVDRNSKIMQEEIFGPVLPVVRVESMDDALDVILARDKPLAMYIFSNGQQVQNRFLSETSSGGVCINDCLLHVSNIELPFGGVGPSGMGAYHGYHGFKQLSHQRAVMTRATWLDPQARYPPGNTKNLQITKMLAGLTPFPAYLRMFSLRNVGVLFAAAVAVTVAKLTSAL
eukprot:GILK01003834.1.p1 GENE.GILK01003834.1~~GILK01003834.1.p1  ORF type:complete len:499 (+),score=104.91 GILK01003834.1:38-1534(+)